MNNTQEDLQEDLKESGKIVDAEILPSTDKEIEPKIEEQGESKGEKQTDSTSQPSGGQHPPHEQYPHNSQKDGYQKGLLTILNEVKGQKFFESALYNRKREFVSPIYTTVKNFEKIFSDETAQKSIYSKELKWAMLALSITAMIAAGLVIFAVFFPQHAPDAIMKLVTESPNWLVMLCGAIGGGVFGMGLVGAIESGRNLKKQPQEYFVSSVSSDIGEGDFELDEPNNYSRNRASSF